MSSAALPSLRVDRWCLRCAQTVGEAAAAHEGHEQLDVPQIHALSLYDPWLWAIDSLPADKAKRIENRPWPPYPWIRRHRWIALHVAQRFDDEGARNRVADLSGIVPPSRDTREMRERRGMITCVARVDGFLYPADAQADMGVGSISLPVRPWWFREQFGWLIGEVVKLPHPVAARGLQKVWRVSVPQALQVAEQIPERVRVALAQPSKDSRE